MSRFLETDIDQAIVRRAGRGDRRALEIIYRAFCAPVYSVCLRFTQVPAHAEDLTQDTFIEVMRSIKSFRGDAPVGSWIRRVAISKALMFLRSAWQKRGIALAEDFEATVPAAPGVQGTPADPDSAMDLDQALARLPEVSRTVVWLHDVEGYTHREIAELLGMTESFSKSQLSRAYRRLRPLLEQENAVREQESKLSAPGVC